MFRHATWFWIAFVIFDWPTMARSGEPAAIDAAWVAKAETGIKALMEKYNALSTRLDEVREIQHVKKGSLRKPNNLVIHPRPIREHTVRLGDNIFLEQAFAADGEKEEITIRCQNTDYGFALTKGMQSRAYALANYEPGKQKSDLADQLAGLHGETFQHFPYILAGLEKSPKYILIRARFDEAKGLLSIDMRYTEIKSDVRFQLDPTNGWRLIERWIETPALTSTDRWSYGTMIDGVCFPTEDKRAVSFKVNGAPPDYEQTERVISIKLTDKADPDFRMSAFGLKEPLGMPVVDRGGTGWYLWFGLVSVGALCVAAVVLQLKGRYFRVVAQTEATTATKEGGS